MRAARVSAGMVGIVVLFSTALYPPQTFAQNVCAQLQQSIQTLRSSGGAGSEYEALATRQLRQYGCLGESSPQESQIPPGSSRCGTGYCQAGTKCSRSGMCIASDAVDCGSRVCPAGNKCTRDGCLPPGAVACGPGFCTAGLSCVNNQCVPEQEAADRSFLTKIFGWGSAWQPPSVPGNQTVSSALEQRNFRTMPTSYGWEKVYDDPYVGKPVTASQLPRPSIDVFGSHPIASQSPKLAEPTPAPGVQSGQQNAATSTSGCGAGYQTMTRGTFQYCEISSPPPQGADSQVLQQYGGCSKNSLTGEFNCPSTFPSAK